MSSRQKNDSVIIFDQVHPLDPKEHTSDCDLHTTYVTTKIGTIPKINVFEATNILISVTGNVFNVDNSMAVMLNRGIRVLEIFRNQANSIRNQIMFSRSMCTCDKTKVADKLQKDPEAVTRKSSKRGSDHLRSLKKSPRRKRKYGQGKNIEACRRQLVRSFVSPQEAPASRLTYKSEFTGVLKLLIRRTTTHPSPPLQQPTRARDWEPVASTPKSSRRFHPYSRRRTSTPCPAESLNGQRMEERQLNSLKELDHDHEQKQKGVTVKLFNATISPIAIVLGPGPPCRRCVTPAKTEIDNNNGLDYSSEGQAAESSSSTLDREMGNGLQDISIISLADKDVCNTSDPDHLKNLESVSKLFAEFLETSSFSFEDILGPEYANNAN